MLDYLFDWSNQSDRFFPRLYAAGTIARVSYYPDTELHNSVARALGDFGYSRIHPNVALDPHVDVWSSPTHIIICPEGTTGPEQLLLQTAGVALTRSTAFPGAVHRAFASMALGLWPRIRSTIQDFAGRPVLLIGHSLGGALALLFYHLLEAERPGASIGVITFGSPRVGDNGFVQSTGANHLRLVAAGDIIANIPPESAVIWQLGFGTSARVNYAHHGRAFIFTAEGEILTDQTLVGWRKRASERAMLAAETRTLSPPINERFLASDILDFHSLDTYQRRIRFRYAVWPFPVVGSYGYTRWYRQEAELDRINTQINQLEHVPWAIEHVPPVVRYFNL